MTRPQKATEASELPQLPDLTVLTKAQTCALTGLSADTLDRLHRQNEGPPRVQLSERRVGYQADPLRKWFAGAILIMTTTECGAYDTKECGPRCGKQRRPEESRSVTTSQ